MADNRPDIVGELSDIASRFGESALADGFERLQDSRLGRTAEGRAALQVAGELAVAYGDDALDWLIRRIQERRAGRRAARASSASAAIDEAAEQARERVRRGLPGEGHQ